METGVLIGWEHEEPRSVASEKLRPPFSEKPSFSEWEGAAIRLAAGQQRLPRRQDGEVRPKTILAGHPQLVHSGRAHL